ncbi:Phospholipid phosphatase 1 [Armadillidium vulgare]|nr:Phospholipid phosphatase 1 [Armadillidium vulgare]
MAKEETSKKKVVVATDIIILLISFAPIFLLESFIEPRRGGFFCSDSSIRYPYVKPIVKTSYLLSFFVGFPIVTISVLECTRMIKDKNFKFSDIRIWIRIIHANGRSLQTHPRKFKTALHRRLLGGGGGGGFSDPTTITECSTTSSNNDDKYIIASDSICDYNKEDYDLIKNARLSFMSAHASISSFSCFFLIFYLQFRVKIKREHVFIKPVLQFVFFILTVLVSLSRIVDHHHHWYDVLAGFVNGILFAAFCCFAILKYGRHYSLRENEKSEEIENTHEQRYVEYEEDTIV